MEREPGIADPPVGDSIVEKVRDPERRQVLPERPDKPVHEIKIDGIGPEPNELLVEILVHVLPGLYKPARELGREVHLFAIPAGKCPSDERFALAVVIGIRGIDIIHTMVDRVPEHPGRRVLVNLPVILYREPHAPEPEDGEVWCGLFHLPVEHSPSPISLIRIACAIRYKCLHAGTARNEPGVA